MASCSGGPDATGQVSGGHRIGLDVQTGVLASICSVGQVTAPPAFEVTIYEVDGPVDLIDEVRKRDLERAVHSRGQRASGWSRY